MTENPSMNAKEEARRPDCVFIATPNNPTGLMPDTALLHKLVSLCESRHIHLIVDEAFIYFFFEKQTDLNNPTF